MNPRQLAYFRELLLEQKRELEFHYRECSARMQAEHAHPADPIDQGVLATERELDCQRRLRNQRSLARIDAALQRIDDGSFGYCEETGEQIGLKRLLIQPLANLSVEAQEHLEQRQRLIRANGLPVYHS
ncbi:RNA polymerase-binding transcription factor DksA [Desulfuromonas versatilis]|uniref:RNA polymerase-binding transcription factor DksA n=2 Tax=Desulfuromonas versatilis TaxID=2802975 RepID=A0ABM8I2F6_9BACT|nr:RNA polymerase-binding transcription factor DksA [Desulfuromonas versatilis]